MTICCVLFGTLHGNAQGIELPVVQVAIIYFMGFMLATVALHGADYLVASRSQTIALRVSGIASIGVIAMITAG